MANSSSQVDEPIYLLEPLLNIKVRNENFQLLLKACNEQQALACKSENKLKSVVSTVNSRLNELEHRSSGIQLLKTLLVHCSDSIFVENSVSWMTQCIRAVANQQNVDEACEVLYLLIEMSHRFQELTKSVSGQIVPKLLDQLLKLKKSPAALQCVEAVLHFYPGPCKVRAKIVEKYLLMFVDEEDKSVVEYASRCMCYLPLLLTTGNKDGNAWTNTLTELCATASSLMFELFQNIHEAAVPPALTELPVGYKLKSLKIDSPVLSIHQVATRIINIFTFIEGMLLGDLTNVKAVRDDLLIALAYRVLAVNCNMVSRGKTLEHVALVCVLPDIHKAGFSLLQTLVSCCNGGLLKYGPLFCKLVLQTLKWTKPLCSYGVERPFSHLREVAYRFLENWVIRSKAASCVELVSEDLITMMLQDIYQKKESVTLQFQEKGKTSSQKQLLQVRQQLVNPKVNFGPCAAALRALSAIIESSGALLGANLHMRLQEVVVTLLLEIKLCSGPKEMPAPYSVAVCRKQLFRLLLALTLHPHPRWPPPTQFSLALFSLGQNDCSLEVAGFCNLAVACTRQMVHPSQSSHQFPKSVDEMRASVGLPNLEVVRGINVTMLNGQNKIVHETDLDVKSSNPEKSQQTPLPKNSLEMNIFQSPNSDKPFKKNLQTSFSDVSLNGIASSPNTSIDTSKSSRKKPRISFNEVSFNETELSSNTSSDISKPHKKKRQSRSVSDLNKKPSTVSDKPSKKIHHLQFTVEELVTSADKITNSNGGQGWEITNVMEVKEKPIEKKFDKSAKTHETSVGMKRVHDGPEDTVTIPKIRKLNESLKKPDGLNNEAPCDKSLDSNTSDNSESGISIQPNVVTDSHINTEPRISINDAENGKETNSVEPNVVINEAGATVEPSFTTNVTTEKESGSCGTSEEKSSGEKKRKQVEIMETGIVETEECESKKSDCGVSSTKSKDNLPNQSPLKSSLDKSSCSSDHSKVESPVAKPHTVSDCKTEEVNAKSPNVSDRKSKEGNSDSPVSDCKSKEFNLKSPVLDCKSKEDHTSKVAIPVVELLQSSDSDSELKKKASVTNRRITRSLAKRTSTPHGNSEQHVSIEELPYSQRLRDDISGLEEESLSIGEDPSVELAESDESAPMNLHIESDRESVDIVDITNNKVDDEVSVVKEKNKTEMSVKQTSPTSNPNSPGSKNLKDSVTSDREIEEVTEEMEAVMDSPDVTVEEVSTCSDKESAAKKSGKETGEDGSGSETNEEEILASFVDALQPNSE